MRVAPPTTATPTSATARLARLAGSIRQALRWSRRRAAIVRELTALNDRMLADIGVARWQIDAVAAQSAGAPAPDVRALAHELGAILHDVLVRPMREWFQRRTTYRDLMGLDDRTLADIGLSRGQIPALIESLRAGHAPAVDSRSADIIRPLRLWNRSRLAAKDLSTLDDRMLSDIGMVRGDIDDVAEELAERSMRPVGRRASPCAA